jgi:ribosome-interacting GTPase 1
MSIKFSPEAIAAEQRYMEANTLEDQIKALREYIAEVPKKGTEKLLSNLKKTLSKLEFKLEKRVEKAKLGKSAIISPFSIKKEGAGQAVIIGMTNSGKSSLMNALTNVNAEVGDYPFKTQLPVVGMLPYEDILIQTIELPAIVEGLNTKEGNGRQILSAIRNSDCVVALIDISMDPVVQMELILQELEVANIRLNMPKLPISITKTGSGGVLVVYQGPNIACDRKTITDLLMDRKIRNAVVKIYENCVVDDVIDALNFKIANKTAIIVANKGDIEGSKEHFQTLTNQYLDRFRIVPISAAKNIGIPELKKEIFELLGVIRVYTKEPGKEPSPKPIVLTKGSVVEDLAKRLHVKFLTNFKYARITRQKRREDSKVTKMQVGLNYELEDRDTVQFFI